jgi:hypothetical protein
MPALQFVHTILREAGWIVKVRHLMFAPQISKKLMKLLLTESVLIAMLGCLVPTLVILELSLCISGI